ncbi:hypothetical protein CK203_058981 [Vitis vinifera]|uniref:Uncharacterized protein n=1 Tax=Vitis vinifera TaxID=29760 RepID=A0A438FTG3_VITVI|nr:hypothetical protein CK203_058981 [Vitis vinifera]
MTFGQKDHNPPYCSPASWTTFNGSFIDSCFHLLSSYLRQPPPIWKAIPHFTLQPEKGIVGSFSLSLLLQKQFANGRKVGLEQIRQSR